MDFVLDASITAAWVLEDEQNDLADEVMDSLAGKVATSPHLWALELANILLVCERRGRIDKTKRHLIGEALRDLGVIEQPQPQGIVFGQVMDLAARHGLSSYDASYLELAIRTGLPLATLDESLQKAAVAEGVSLLGST